MTEVAAALIWKDDTFMICRRPAHKARGLLWEFVGGKLEEGETAPEALVRECREEIGVTVKPLSLFMDVIHAYPDLTVHLMVYNAVIESGEIRMFEHVDIKWIKVSEIENYSFCPADVEILNKLVREAK